MEDNETSIIGSEYCEQVYAPADREKYWTNIPTTADWKAPPIVGKVLLVAFRNGAWEVTKEIIGWGRKVPGVKEPIITIFNEERRNHKYVLRLDRPSRKKKRAVKAAAQPGPTG